MLTRERLQIPDEENPFFNFLRVSFILLSVMFVTGVQEAVKASVNNSPLWLWMYCALILFIIVVSVTCISCLSPSWKSKLFK